MAENSSLIYKTIEQRAQQAHLASLVAGYDFSHPRDRIAVGDYQRLHQEHPRLWESYVGALRAIRKGQALSELLDIYLDEKSRLPGVPHLRPRQMGVVRDIENSLHDGKIHRTVVMPTGSGKTVVFAKIAEGLRQRTLVVTESQIGVEQIEKGFRKFVPTMSVGKVYGRGEKLYDSQVTITTYASLKLEVAGGRIRPEDFGLVIFDEAHKSLTLDRIEIANKFKNNVRLAFTATPKYTEEKQVENVFGLEIPRLYIREAVANKLLAPRISSYVVKTDVDISNVNINAEGDYSETDLANVINTEEVNQAALQTYRRNFLGESTVMNCAGVKHALDLTRILNAELSGEGIIARTITGDTSPEERDSVIDAFRRGEIHILCNARVLTYSFDAPNATVCFNLAPTLSPVLAEQRGGRVTRWDDANPSKHARIIDFLAKSFSPKHSPVLYAQILGEAEIDVGSYPDVVSPRRGVVSSFPNKDVTVSGIHVLVTDPEEVMQIARELDFQEALDHLVGFFTFPEILRRIPEDRRVTLIRKLADEIRDRDFIERGFSDDDKNAHSLYYPEVTVATIIDQLKNTYPTPGKEWKVLTSVADKLGRKWQNFEKIVAADIQEHPERAVWVGRFWNRRGESEYLHDEYIIILERELARSNKSLPPNSIVGTRRFKEATGFVGGVGTLNRVVAELAIEHPEWLGSRLEGSHVYTTYTAELAVAMRRYVAERQAVAADTPDTWTVTFEDLSHSIAGVNNKHALRELILQRIADQPDATDFGIRREPIRGTVGIRMTPERREAFLQEFRSRNDELPAGNRIMISDLVEEIVRSTGENSGSVLTRVNRWLNAKEDEYTIQRKRDFGEVFNYETKKMGRAVTLELAEKMRQDAKLFGK